MITLLCLQIPIQWLSISSSANKADAVYIYTLLIQRDPMSR